MAKIVDNELIGEEIEFKCPSMRLSDYVEQTVKHNIANLGDSAWLTEASSGNSTSYSQLLSNIKIIASSLYKRGFRLGDVVVIIASNQIEFALMLLSVWKAGGVVACFTLNLSKDDIVKRAKRDLRPAFFLTDQKRAERVVQAAGELDTVKDIFIINGEATGCTPFSQLLNDNGDDCQTENLPFDMESMVWLMYSSGTTGVSKGQVHTHRSVITHLYHLSLNANPKRTKFLFENFLVNAGGMVMLLTSTLTHFDIYCVAEMSFENFLVAIDRVKPTVVSTFPSQIAWICKHERLEDYDVSSVVSLSTMGSIVHPIYEREIFNKLPNLLFLNIMYGMTEGGLFCSNHPKPNEISRIDKQKAIARHVFGSSGKVFPNCKLKIIDPSTGEKMPPGQAGEICYQTPYIMKEYLNMPKETAELIRGGYCYTGDRGYYDTEGNVFIIGRYKELLKYRMAHVVPTNIEKHMLMHPAIEDVAVVGLPHDIDGEHPLAFVVLRSEHQVKAEELIQFTNERVVEEEKLRGGIRFIDKIPRNELGKIMRPQLSKLLQVE